MKKTSKLQSIVSFILDNEITDTLDKDVGDIHRDYANFLNRKLNLGMFLPCDLEGNILKDALYTTNHSDDCYCQKCENETKRCSDEQQKYREAKERVLFEGDFELSSDCIEIMFHSVAISRNVNSLGVWRISDLLGLELTLTEFGINESGFKNIEL